MRDLGRFLITGFIWAIVGVIGIIAVDAGVDFGSVVITALGLTFAYVTTRSLWGLDSGGKKESASKGKRKRHEVRSEKIEMLLAMMDDDEKAAFKAALAQRLLDSTARLNDDGEIPMSISDLFDEEESRRSKR